MLLEQVNSSSLTLIFVKYSSDTLLHVYEWKLCTSAVTSVNTALVDKAHTLTFSTDTDCMKPQDLHCTAYKHEGKDAEFEKRWFKEGCLREKLTLNCMFWNKHRCAVSVTLPKPTKSKLSDEFLPSFSFSDSLFDVPGSYPRVTCQTQERKMARFGSDLGEKMCQCRNMGINISTYVQYNPVLKVYRQK